MNPSDKIKQLQRLAKKRGGKCLSLTYKNSVTKLDWQCAKEHQWEALPGNIKQGTWCPYCSGKLKLTIEQMRRIAEKNDGKCLSDKYHDSHTKLFWKCSLGHQWQRHQHLLNKDHGVRLARSRDLRLTKTYWACKI